MLCVGHAQHTASCTGTLCELFLFTLILADDVAVLIENLVENSVDDQNSDETEAVAPVSEQTAPGQPGSC